MAMGFAIIGTGIFADGRIVPALTRATNCRPVAIVSRDRERAAAFASEHGLPSAYDDLSAALADPRVEAVWVSVPHNLHRGVVEAAARARKHVLCEKPLATTVDDGRAIVAACRRAGVALGTGFHLRHHPLHKEMRRLVQAGALGQVQLADGEWSLESPLSNASAWRRDPEVSGGGIGTGTGVHVIDLLRFVLDDEVAAVSAVAAPAPGSGQVETQLVATLQFRSGTLATVRCVRPVRAPANDLVLEGTAGSLIGRGTIDEITRGRLEAGRIDANLSGVPAGTEMYAAQVQSFVEAAYRGDDPDASGNDGLTAVRITAAMYESARTGHITRLS